jgi:hypothetical protein
MDIDHVTSTLSEVMNSSMKRTSTKTMSKMNIDTASKTMLRHSESMDSKRNIRNANQLNRRLESTLPNDVVTHLTDYSHKVVEEMYRSKDWYNVIRVNENQWIAIHKGSFTRPEPLFPEVPIAYHAHCYELTYDSNQKCIECTCLSKRRCSPHTGTPRQLQRQFVNRVVPFNPTVLL